MSHLDGFCSLAANEAARILGLRVSCVASPESLVLSWRPASKKKGDKREVRVIDFDPRRGVERDEVLARVKEAI